MVLLMEPIYQAKDCDLSSSWRVKLHDVFGMSIGPFHCCS